MECTRIVLRRSSKNPLIARWVGWATLAVKQHEAVIKLSVGVMENGFGVFCGSCFPRGREKLRPRRDALP
jgi:hypothetical protein